MLVCYEVELLKLELKLRYSKLYVLSYLILTLILQIIILRLVEVSRKIIEFIMFEYLIITSSFDNLRLSINL